MIFDIIAGTGDTTGGIGSWTPAELVQATVKRVRGIDASDWSLMFQDGPATHPSHCCRSDPWSHGSTKFRGQPTQYDIWQIRALLLSNDMQAIMESWQYGLMARRPSWREYVSENFTVVNSGSWSKERPTQRCNMFLTCNRRYSTYFQIVLPANGSLSYSVRIDCKTICTRNSLLSSEHNYCWYGSPSSAHYV